MTNQLETVSLALLDSVFGGTEGSGKVETPAGIKVEGQFKTDPPKPVDTEKQLRCYRQVAEQAHFYDSSNKTLRQQLQLCGPLRPDKSN